jgi:hypothetical protein
MVNKNNGQKRIMVKNIIVKTRMSNNINGQTMTMVKQWQWSNNDNGQTMNNGQKEEWSKRRMVKTIMAKQHAWSNNAENNNGHRPRSSWLQVPRWWQNVSQGISHVAPPHFGKHSHTGSPPGNPIGLQTPLLVPPHWCKHHWMLQSLPDQPSAQVQVNVSLPPLPSLQVPWPEQSFSHRRMPHPMPVKFALQVQSPWLHMPFPLHCCGHATNPHALPCQPMSHKQPSAVQVPWWEHC